MTSTLKEITDATFSDAVVASSDPVLVDFWAPWCGPCQMLGPILEEVSEALQGKIHVVKLNIDDNPMSPTHFGVRSVPTLMLFKGGEVVGTQVGVHSKAKLISWIEGLVA